MLGDLLPKGFSFLWTQVRVLPTSCRLVPLFTAALPVRRKVAPFLWFPSVLYLFDFKCLLAWRSNPLRRSPRMCRGRTESGRLLLFSGGCPVSGVCGGPGDPYFSDAPSMNRMQSQRPLPWTLDFRPTAGNPWVPPHGRPVWSPAPSGGKIHLLPWWRPRATVLTDLTLQV